MRRFAALLLFCLVVLPISSMADSIILDSRAGVNATCAGDPACPTGPTSTVVIPKNVIWASPFGTSQWVSVPFTNGGESGNHSLPNFYSPADGTAMVVSDTFISPVSEVQLMVLADDTTSVLISGGAFSYAAALGAGNTYGNCSDVTIGCILPTAGIFDITLTPGVTYDITFDTVQRAGSSFGLDYEITAVPEPATLPMLGAALLAGAAWMRRSQARRIKPAQ